MLAKFSVKKPYTVLVGVILVVVLGIVSLTKMSADLLPDINLPYVVVMTTYVGASPETVETVVTSPVEQAMATISNIEGINSMSAENYSVVILEFSQKANMDSVSLDIRESLDQLESYWDDSVGSPIIMKLNPNMLPTMITAVGMEGMSASEVGDFVEEKIVPEIESIEGVASVSTNGIIEESLSVAISAEKVSKLNDRIYDLIDEKFEEAYDEIETHEKEMSDGVKEIEKAEKEISKGEKEIKDAEKKLADGRKELTDKQNATSEELANAKLQLLTAKADIEAAKTNITTNLTTLNTLTSSKKQLEDQKTELENTRAGLVTQLNGLNTQRADLVTQKEGLQEQLDAIVAAEPLLATFTSGVSSIVDAYNASLMTETDANNALAGAFAAFSGTPMEAMFASVDKTVTNVALVPTIEGIVSEIIAGKSQLETGITAIDTGIAQIDAGIPQLQAGIDQIDDGLPMINDGLEQIQANIDNLTMGLSPEDYTNTQNQIMAQLNGTATTVDNGILQLYAGADQAVIGFANGLSQMDLADYQLAGSKAEVESGKKQLETSKQQLEDGKKALEDGKEQIEDQKEKAKESADMSAILSVDMISQILTAQNFSMPAGYVEEDGNSFLIRVGDKPSSLEEMSDMVLMKLPMTEDEVVRLSDVADVFMISNEDEVYTNVNGEHGVVLTIQKQTGYSTGNVSDSLTKKFNTLHDKYEGSSMVVLMDQGVYIDLVMSTIFENILLGGLLAVIVLILFLRDIRPTLIITVSIPVSLIAAVVCMYFSGVTLNIISLSGLALGVGMLVDNSIVVIENIYRLRNEGMDIKEAAVEGAKEVAGAIFASTLTTVCVFLPIVFTEGITRQLFVDMGLTIGFSLMASLLVALTVVPACAKGMLKKIKKNATEQKRGKLYYLYEKFLRGCLKVKWLVLLLSVVLLGLSAWGAYSNGFAYFPDMESNQVTVSVDVSEDSEPKDIKAETDMIVSRISEIEDVVDIGAMSSSTSLSLFGASNDDSMVTSSTIYVVTKEKNRKYTSKELAAEIIKKTEDVEGVDISVQTSTMDMSALGGSGVTVNVKGRDLDTLYEMAERVGKVMEETEGTAKVKSDIEDSSAELRIHVDKEKAALKGLTVATIYMQVMNEVSDPSVATTLTTATDDISVYVEDTSKSNLSRRDIKNLKIEYTNDEGEKDTVLLREVADFEDGVGMNTINREDQSRYVSVSAEIADGYNVTFVTQEITKKVQELDILDGCSIEFAGENEMIMDAIRQLALMVLLAIVFIYLIMVAQFQSLGSPFIIMFTIPLAFTGGFAALFFSGFEVSIVAMIGFVMLSGIIVNNGIVLVDYINQRIEQGLSKKEAIIDAGITRLRPVLMTALTTILGLLMMAVSHKLGSDMSRPLAIVVIGGMTYGTLMTLIVVPCIYDWFVREKKVDD